MNIIVKTSLLLSLAFPVYTGNSYAQIKTTANPVPVFNSPKGPVLIFGASSIDGNGRDREGNQYVISRAERNSPVQKQIALPGMVTSLTAFKKIVGESILQQLQRQLKQKSADQLWQYIQQHPDLSAYGFMALSIPFRTAMGAAYTDQELKESKGKTFIYTVEIRNANHVSNNLHSAISIGRIPDFEAPHLMMAKASDSTVSIRWQGKMRQDIPYLAFVYRQTGGKGDFKKLPARILASRKGDTLNFLFTEKVNGNSAYRYFIRPADLLENEGLLNSDTSSLVAVDYRKLPVISNLKVRDSLNALFLSWKPLPANPMLTGIEIQRSRDSRGDYVVIDTIPAGVDFYRDSKLLPHVAYYYRLSVLHSGTAATAKFYTSVSAASQKTNHVPNAPYGATATAVKNGTHINWQPVVDPDIYAYYVYRATSMNGKMQVISPALTDTSFTDTATNLSRQISYVYAVTAVSNASMESPFSEKIPARFSMGRERPRTPGGIRVVQENNRLKLQWEDVKKDDPAILGYFLFKHKMDTRPLSYSVTKPASAEATRLKLMPVFPGLITDPYFEDTISHTGDRYEYLVSAIDLFGAESGLSSSAISARIADSRAEPPAAVYVRSVTEGVALQWEEAEGKGVQSFAIYRRTINEKSFKKIALVKTPANQYTDRQAIPGTLNIYAVSAITSTGESRVSTEKSIRR